MGKTRDLFKKIRDTKGTFHEKMGSIKERNGVDLTEVEDIKKRWQEYTELYKKDLHNPDNHPSDHSPRARHPGMQSSKEYQEEKRKPSSAINAKKQRKTIEWERLEVSSRKLEIPSEQLYTKMGTIKDRNGMDLTEAEDIKKRW